MADGAIQTALDMNPVGENNKTRKFIHPLPRNLFPCFYIFYDFKCLWPLADGIAGMTGLTEFNVWNSCNTIPFNIPVAECTVQMGYLFVVNMIKKDRLLDRFPREDWKDRKEETFGRILKSMIGKSGEKKNEDNGNEKA
jgi:hypothetical protein